LQKKGGEGGKINLTTIAGKKHLAHQGKKKRKRQYLFPSKREKGPSRFYFEGGKNSVRGGGGGLLQQGRKEKGKGIVPLSGGKEAKRNLKEDHPKGRKKKGKQAGERPYSENPFREKKGGNNGRITVYLARGGGFICEKDKRGKKRSLFQTGEEKISTTRGKRRGGFLFSENKARGGSRKS